MVIRVCAMTAKRSVKSVMRSYVKNVIVLSASIALRACVKNVQEKLARSESAPPEE